jgi:hypothetical protein
LNSSAGSESKDVRPPVGRQSPPLQKRDARRIEIDPKRREHWRTAAIGRREQNIAESRLADRFVLSKTRLAPSSGDKYDSPGLCRPAALHTSVRLHENGVASGAAASNARRPGLFRAPVAHNGVNAIVASAVGGGMEDVAAPVSAVGASTPPFSFARGACPNSSSSRRTLRRL